VNATSLEDRIFCATEDLLANVVDPQEAYETILRRIEQRNQAAEPVLEARAITVERGTRTVLRELDLVVNRLKHPVHKEEARGARERLERALAGGSS